jgi:hypothetical protein
MKKTSGVMMQAEATTFVGLAIQTQGKQLRHHGKG